MARVDEQVPPPASAVSEEQWRRFALATFGGNELRATAAARAAVMAQAAGASPDAAFGVARAAYEAEPVLDRITPEPGGTRASKPVNVIRPSGRVALAATLGGALASGAITYVVKVRDAAFLWMLVAGSVALVLWFGLCLRERVLIQGASVQVQGLVRAKRFRRADVDRIVVQNSTAWWTRRWEQPRFIALFVGQDATLARTGQGAWTRSDIDRVAAAIGTHVEDEQTP